MVNFSARVCSMIRDCFYLDFYTLAFEKIEVEKVCCVLPLHLLVLSQVLYDW